MQRHYNEFVSHCLRFYIRIENPKFSTEASRRDWDACDTVLNAMEKNDRELITAIFTKGDILRERVAEVAEENNIDVSTLWRIVQDTTIKIAKARGLI